MSVRRCVAWTHWRTSRPRRASPLVVWLGSLANEGKHRAPKPPNLLLLTSCCWCCYSCHPLGSNRSPQDRIINQSLITLMLRGPREPILTAYPFMVCEGTRKLGHPQQLIIGNLGKLIIFRNLVSRLVSKTFRCLIVTVVGRKEKLWRGDAETAEITDSSEYWSFEGRSRGARSRDTESDWSSAQRTSRGWYQQVQGSIGDCCRKIARSRRCSSR